MEIKHNINSPERDTEHVSLFNDLIHFEVLILSTSVMGLGPLVGSHSAPSQNISNNSRFHNAFQCRFFKSAIIFFLRLVVLLVSGSNANGFGTTVYLILTFLSILHSVTLTPSDCLLFNTPGLWQGSCLFHGAWAFVVSWLTVSLCKPQPSSRSMSQTPVKQIRLHLLSVSLIVLT